MSVFDSKEIKKQHIKVRWKEPYVSEALNRKGFGNQPAGVYVGFGIVPVGFRTYAVTSENPINFHGNPNNYDKGQHTAVSGYSIAIFEDNLGFSTTVQIPPSANVSGIAGVSGFMTFDFDGVSAGEERIIALDVDYAISNETQGQILAIDEDEMDLNPEYLVLGVVTIPADGVSASIDDVDYENDDYPRTLPFATPKKYGYMSPQQALILEGIGAEADSIYCSTDDAEVLWTIGDGGVSGVLDFTGTVVYNQPTVDFNVTVTVSGTSVSGIEDGDVVFFTFPLDGSQTTAALQVAPNNAVPTVTAGEQLAIFGIRCNNDWWFKNGHKWEVGEFKPFGVTSKFPNLTVGETGNPPLSDNVSGIFFDNAQVTVLPGEKDVRVFVNVSGSIPNSPLEEEFLVSNILGQSSFTTTEPDLFWILDDDKLDITATRNGIKLIQYSSATSGVTDSIGEPIWGYVKTGTRTIQTRTPVPLDGVVQIRLEADKGTNAYEESHLTVVSGVGDTIVNALRPFSSDNDVHDIKVYRNGAKVQFEDSPFNPKIHGVKKIAIDQLEFTDPLKLDTVVTIRHESSQVIQSQGTSGGGGGGDFWFDPVDASLIPDAPGVYNVGEPGSPFNQGHFAGDAYFESDVYIGGKMYVTGGIDPEYVQYAPQTNGSLIPLNSIFVDDSTGTLLSFKDSGGIVRKIICEGASGASAEEEEIMQNSHAFAIEAPRAVSLSVIGNSFELTDFQNSESMKRYFGILTENVSGLDFAPVRWRGRMSLPGFLNGLTWVSGQGELVQESPSVSGDSILGLGIVKDEVLFLRPSDGLDL